MSLNIEEIKLIPSTLQTLIENGDSVFVRCQVRVPKSRNETSFRINISSCKLVKECPEISDMGGTLLVGKTKPNTYDCVLNFPINKVVRGIHPCTILTDKQWLEANNTKSEAGYDVNTYSWEEQLQSWVSVYDTELSSYVDTSQIPGEQITCEEIFFLF